MGIEKFTANAGKYTWEFLEKGFFSFVKRKTNEGVRRFLFVRRLREKLIKIDWGFVAQEYLSYMQEYHSQFHVFGMGEQKLEDLSTKVFLFTKPEHKREDVFEIPEKINGLKFIFQDERGEKVVVFGTAGSGKTTFLKQIVKHTIEQTNKIPLFVNSAEWALLGTINYKGLLIYLSEQFESCGFKDATTFIDYLLEDGHAVLLIDGLDEMPLEKRNRAIAFLNSYKESKSKIIATCRVDAISGSPTGYSNVGVASWDEIRINSFIEKRFPNKELREKFTKEINDENSKSFLDFKKKPLIVISIMFFLQCCNWFSQKQRRNIYRSNSSSYRGKR
jgi:predicted NACHT family NTPase